MRTPQDTDQPFPEDVQPDDTPEEELAAQISGTNMLRERAGLPPLPAEQLRNAAQPAR